MRRRHDRARIVWAAMDLRAGPRAHRWNAGARHTVGWRAVRDRARARGDGAELRGRPRRRGHRVPQTPRLVCEGAAQLRGAAATTPCRQRLWRSRGDLRRLPPLAPGPIRRERSARGRRHRGPGARWGVIRDRVLALLRQVADGQLDINDALDRLARDPVESLPFATIDHHRALRQGYPEVILGQGKTTEQVVTIAERIAARGEGFLVTRASPDALDSLGRAFARAEINAVARCAHLAPTEPVPSGHGTILIVTAGTSDLPVAEEAAV